MSVITVEWSRVSSPNFTIADLKRPWLAVCMADHPAREANARLIAAAPDMLEVLKAVRGIFTEGNMADLRKAGLIVSLAPGTAMGIHSAICHAIAKAEGRTE